MHERDDDLVRQALTGNHQACATIVEDYNRSVYNLCLRMMASRDEAEDLAQETFLRLFSSLDRYRPGSGLRPWLNRIAVNACLDVLRKRQRRPYLVPIGRPDGLDDNKGMAELALPTDEPTPELAFLQAEQRQAVLEAVRSLPLEYRAVIVLRYQQDMSYQEIATTLDEPLTTVETRLFRAKKMLRPLLTNYRRSGDTDAASTRKEAMRRGM